MIPFAEARAHVVDACTVLPATEVDLADACGLVLAADVVAGEAVPPFANTAMDGYAVRAVDTLGASTDAPAVLEVVDELHAGRAPGRAVGPGEAIRIMTGAPMPDGADAVVMVERTQRLGDTQVSVHAEVSPGQHVRRAGDDVEVGDVVCVAGEALTPGHLGVLATIGVARVQVVPRPVVAVLSTGDELVEGGGPLAPGQIRESNRPALLAALSASGFAVHDCGIVRDDEQAIHDAMHAATARCDALVTTGGVSMGDVDLVKVVLDRIGAMRWMQVAIKPAKPLAFGTVARADGTPVPVFGLPGNPVSSMVSLELFARPALRRMAGHPDDALDRPRIAATADEGLPRQPDGKTHFVRVRVRYDDGHAHVVSAGAQGSHQLTALARADGLAVVPDGDGVPAGGSVLVIPIR